MKCVTHVWEHLLPMCPGHTLTRRGLTLHLHSPSSLSIFTLHLHSPSSLSIFTLHLHSPSSLSIFTPRLQSSIPDYPISNFYSPFPNLPPQIPTTPSPAPPPSPHESAHS